MPAIAEADIATSVVRSGIGIAVPISRIRGIRDATARDDRQCQNSQRQKSPEMKQTRH
jgi:ribose 5-phosphate isomerase RpiB